MKHLRADRLPALQGPAAWNLILGPAPERVPLTGARTADVVIVGAGFAGLSAARRLQQIDPRAAVTVLEAGRIAESSAGRNSGFMIDLPHDLASEDYAGAGDDRAMIALNRQAIAFAFGAVTDYQIDAHFFDRAGKVNGAASATAHAHNQSYAAHLASLGEQCEMLDAQAMVQLTGSRHYLGGGLHARHGDAAACGLYPGACGGAGARRRADPRTKPGDGADPHRRQLDGDNAAGAG